MILRLWRGRVPARRRDEYEDYQRQVGPPGYRVIEGNRGILMLGQDHGERYEIAMLTIWSSWGAIRAFAGDPVERARYYDRDFEFLIDPPDEVEHFEVVTASPIDSRARRVRLWRAPVDSDRLAEALRLASETGIPACREATGNRGSLLLARPHAGRHEVAMLTLWESLDAIRALADEPIESLAYGPYPEPCDNPVDVPRHPEHFDVLAAENFDRAGSTTPRADPPEADLNARSGGAPPSRPS